MDQKTSQNRKTLKHLGVGFGIAVVLLVTCAMTYSYLENPKFCGSCHAMTDHYTTWQASTHRGVACTECHLPNEGLATKLVAKAKTGVVDVYHQTVGDVPLDIQVTAEGKEYLLDNCLRCHEAAVENTTMVDKNEGKDCTSCHRELVHND